MPEFTIRFEVEDPESIRLGLPEHLLKEGGRYRVDVHGEAVYVSGNSQGLLYLAEVIVRCASGAFSSTAHAHLPRDSTSNRFDAAAAGTEIVIFAGEL